MLPDYLKAILSGQVTISAVTAPASPENAPASPENAPAGATPLAERCKRSKGPEKRKGRPSMVDALQWGPIESHDAPTCNTDPDHFALSPGEL